MTPVVHTDLQERLARPQAHVLHRNVDGAEALQRVGHHALHIVRVRDVPQHPVCLHSVALGLHSDRFERVDVVAAIEHHVGTGLGESKCDALAKITTRSGD